MNLSAQQQGQAIGQAATKYQVPFDVLVGVYGQETSFGQNISTSSANAQGAFQFIPSTAASYGYPLTNNPTAAQFQQQANAAAHYLSDLYHQTGSWDSAAQRYSGGGYGLSQLKSQFSHAPASVVDAALRWVAGNVLNSHAPTFGIFGIGPSAPAGTSPPGTSVTGPTSGPDVAGAITGVFNQVTKDAKYAAVLLVVLAAAAFLMVHGLTGETPASLASRAVP